MSKQKTSYQESVQELNKILKELENDTEINLDNISEKVKRAAVLLDNCKKQLRELDTELEKILEQINN